jgi:basic membrane lipoprotein Med (substrate-binding protein (PBP1-ABC) superfamily)
MVLRGAVKWLGLGLVFALTACSSVVSEPKVTPVEYKACLITSGDNRTDESSLNRNIYAALTESRARFGVAIDVVESPRNAGATRYAAELKSAVKSGCKLVVSSGDSLLQPVIDEATAHAATTFMAFDVADSTASLKLPANLTAFNFALEQSGLAAGYLAAAKTTRDKVGLLYPAEVGRARTVVTGFIKGVTIFNGSSSKRVTVYKSTSISNLQADDVDIIFYAGLDRSLVTNKDIWGFVRVSPGQLIQQQIQVALAPSPSPTATPSASPSLSIDAAVANPRFVILGLDGSFVGAQAADLPNAADAAIAELVNQLSLGEISFGPATNQK